MIVWTIKKDGDIRVMTARCTVTGKTAVIPMDSYALTRPTLTAITALNMSIPHSIPKGG